jgi:hypothetical protein
MSQPFDWRFTMKKPFNAPRLKNHGALEEVTQLFGSGSRQDTGSFNGQTFSFPGVTGSRDGIVVPTP